MKNSLRLILKKIRGGSILWTNFYHMARSNLIGVALLALATPIFTRIYTSEQYGDLAIFMSAVGLCTSFCTFKVDWSIPNARYKAEALNLLYLGLVFLLLFCCALLLVFIFLRERYSDIPFFGLGLSVYLAPVGVMGFGIRTLMSSWYVRKNQLSDVSQATIIQSNVNLAATLICGAYIKLRAIGLILAWTIGVWAGNKTLITDNVFRPGNVYKNISRKRVGLVLKKHGGDVFWSALTSLVGSASTNIPVLFLALYYLPQEIGWFSLLYRLVAGPIALFAGSLGQAFWAFAAKYSRDGRYHELKSLYQITTYRLVVACLPIILLCIFGSLLIGPILGEREWGGAGKILLAMIPMLCGLTIFSATNHLVVLRMQKLQFLADSVRLLLSMAAIWISKLMSLDFFAVILLVSLSSLIGHLVLYMVHIKAHEYYAK